MKVISTELDQRVEDQGSDLGETRAALHAVLEQLPAGAVIAEAPSGRIIVANARVDASLRASAPTLEAYRKDGSRYEPHDWPLARAIERGETIELVLGDGSRAVLSASAGPIRDEFGEIAAGVVIFTDVSDREWRERAQRDFITNAAHELQTPLTAIMAATEVLQAGAKEDPVERDRFLGHIEAECDRLGRLVRALLVLARAQVGGDAAPQAVIELRPLLDEVALSLRPAKGVEVLVRCREGLAVLGSPELLAQALLNLGANAAKQTSAGRISLSARRRAGRVAIEIADTGPGLPSGSEGRIFERFFRGGARDRDGFGLGLAIVREAVAAMGGTVDIRPLPKGGTVATVELPVP